MEIINLKAEPFCFEKTELVCPHCNHFQKISKHWKPLLARNSAEIYTGTGEFQCNNCMDFFSYRYEAEMYFTSFKKRGLFK